MSTTVEAIDVYRKLAEEHNRLNHPQERDRFLLLAADAALTAGQREEADRFRKSILGQNPNHLLKPYASLEEALKSSDILAYVQQLRRSYPQEKAASLLESLKRKAPSPASPSAPAAPPADGEEELVLPLDVGSGKPAMNFTLDKPEVKKPSRPKEVRMSGDPQKPKPPASAPPTWQTGPSPAASAASGPGIFGLKPEAPPAPRPPLLAVPQAPKPEPEETPAGGWVGKFLAVVVVLTAIALLVYTIGAPFVPWW